ncbi:MAG TPA: YggT family protein [Actinomycetota bacterium]|jgi:YggT family protein
MEFVCLALVAYTFILFARVILSFVLMAWSPPPSATPIIRIIYDLTEPPMAMFRRYIPPVGGFDLSALIIFLILGIIRSQIGC